MSKTVTRSDQAFFKWQQKIVKACVVQMGGDSQHTSHHGIEIILIGEEAANDKVATMVEDKKHAIFSANVSCLVPVSDIDDKLQKEVKDKQTNIEKTMRTLVAVSFVFLSIAFDHSAVQLWVWKWLQTFDMFGRTC